MVDSPVEVNTVYRVGSSHPTPQEERDQASDHVAHCRPRHRRGDGLQRAGTQGLGVRRNHHRGARELRPNDLLACARKSTLAEWVPDTPTKATGTPITLGMVNQENTPAASFPELSQADEAAVAFVNDQLGGVDGHPIKLDVCNTKFTAEGSTALRAAIRRREGARGARWDRRVRQQHRHPRPERHPVRGRRPGEQPVGDERQLVPVQRRDVGRGHRVRLVRHEHAPRQARVDRLRRVRLDHPERPVRREGAQGPRRAGADGAVPDPGHGHLVCAAGRRADQARRGDGAGRRQRLQGRLRRDPRARSAGADVLRGRLRIAQHHRQRRPRTRPKARSSTSRARSSAPPPSRTPRSTRPSPRSTARATTRSVPAPSPSGRS